MCPANHRVSVSAHPLDDPSPVIRDELLMAFDVIGLVDQDDQTRVFGDFTDEFGGCIT